MRPMTRGLLLALLLTTASGLACAQAATRQELRDRCTRSIAESGAHVVGGKFKESAIDLAASGFLFQFDETGGGTFFCQICDDANPAVECGSVGLTLNYRPAGGESKALPAELDRKCAWHLHREVGDRAGREKIQHAVIERIEITPAHTDSRWVYRMALDGGQYRCVVRRSDGSFRVEQQTGDDWRALAAGIFF